MSVDLVARLSGDFRLASFLAALKTHVQYETEWGMNHPPNWIVIDHAYCVALRIRNDALQRLVKQAVRMGVITRHYGVFGITSTTHMYEVHLERIEQLEYGT